MTLTRPKYSLPEIERRWLVPESLVPDLAGVTAVVIRDRYLAGTRLRLRRITAPSGDVSGKLCKKYGDAAGAESITNLYLDAGEFATLDTLPGVVVEKRRFAIAGGSLDCYVGHENADRLYVFEVAAGADYQPPDFVEREITGVREFSGAELATRFGRADAHR